MQKHKHCQSCGMPMKRDENGGGSNADGSLSGTYCSHCYVAGRFVQPDLRVEDMRALVIGKLQQFGFPTFVARFFARNIQQLQRWRATDLR